MESLRKYLALSGVRLTETEFLSGAGIASFSVAAFFAALGASWTTAIAIGLVVGAALLYAPVLLARIRAERAEADLPYVLRSLASEVEAGIPFDLALADAANLSSAMGKDIQRVLQMYKKGIPMDNALKAIGDSFASENVKRAMLHIALLYQSGAEASPIKKMADELLAIQKAESKKFSSELAMFTLVFVAVAALVPALFAMYVMIGSTILDMNMTPGMVRMIMLGAFPLASGLALAYMYARLPAYMRR